MPLSPGIGSLKSQETRRRTSNDMSFSMQNMHAKFNNPKHYHTFTYYQSFDVIEIWKLAHENQTH